MFEVKDGKISEKSKLNCASAYMLVYVREAEIPEIMKEVTVDDIPQ